MKVKALLITPLFLFLLSPAIRAMEENTEPKIKDLTHQRKEIKEQMRVYCEKLNRRSESNYYHRKVLAAEALVALNPLSPQ